MLLPLQFIFCGRSLQFHLIVNFLSHHVAECVSLLVTLLLTSLINFALAERVATKAVGINYLIPTVPRPVKQKSGLPHYKLLGKPLLAFCGNIINQINGLVNTGGGNACE